MTAETWILPDAVVLPDRIAKGLAVRVVDGRIAACTPAGSAPAGDTPAERASGQRVTRIPGMLLPGMLDLQVNGAGGADCATATDDALDTVARAVWAGGATGFLPTLITQPMDALCERLARVADWCKRRRIQNTSAGPADGDRGAEAAVPLGIHVEGPFLQQPGAHPAEDLLDPTSERVERLLEACAGELRLLTLACARPGAAAATAKLRSAGVAVAIGHVTSPDGFTDCIEAGAGAVTHLFNAMGALHHRDPGVPGLALDDPRVLCPIIPDGLHVDPVMIRHAYRICGPDRLALVTDAMAAAGMPDGDYELSGMPVTLREGVVRKPDGTLAGAALTMDQGARRFLRFVPDAGQWTIARLTASNPAGLLGEHALGHGAIQPGAVAAFAVWDGERYRALRS